MYDIERAGFEAADRIIAVSHFTKETIVHRYSIDPAKITVVHNAVEKERRLGQLRVKKPFKEKLVLFLGRITFQKGPDYFVEAAAKVLEKNPDVRFAMAGTGDMLPRMVERMAELRLADRFHFLGFVRGADVERIYAMSEPVRHAQRVRALRHHPAGGHGLRRAVHRVQAVRRAEVLEDAVKVDFWDVDRLAFEIQDILEDEERAGELGEKGARDPQEGPVGPRRRAGARRLPSTYRRPVMISVCFYFQVHQPMRLDQKYTFFDIGRWHDYRDDKANRDILRKVAEKCYLPANRMMLDLIERHKGRFRISYAITGVAMEQFQEFCPEVLDSFRELADTGCVEFIGETHYHSLAFLFSKEEFRRR